LQEPFVSRHPGGLEPADPTSTDATPGGAHELPVQGAVDVEGSECSTSKYGSFKKMSSGGNGMWRKKATRDAMPSARFGRDAHRW
jgi:hypothetical protein